MYGMWILPLAVLFFSIMAICTALALLLFVFGPRPRSIRRPKSVPALLSVALLSGLAFGGSAAYGEHVSGPPSKEEWAKSRGAFDAFVTRVSPGPIRTATRQSLGKYSIDSINPGPDNAVSFVVRHYSNNYAAVVHGAQIAGFAYLRWVRALLKDLLPVSVRRLMFIKWTDPGTSGEEGSPDHRGGDRQVS